MSSLLTNVIDSNWDEMYNSVVKFVDEFKCLPSKLSDDDNEKTLGLWCNYQCQKFKGGFLNRKKVETLNHVPEWVWEPVNDFQISLDCIKELIEDECSWGSMSDFQTSLDFIKEFEDDKDKDSYDEDSYDDEFEGNSTNYFKPSLDSIKEFVEEYE